MRSAPSAFTRDRITVLIYGMSVSFGYAMAALGPAMPLLRDDLGLSRTVGGLHFASIAAGSILAGLSVDLVVRRFGRRVVFWVGGSGLAVGSLIIAVAQGPAVSLAGAAFMGLTGSAMLAVSQATLADAHAANRATAIAEAYTATSLGSMIPALVIGFAIGVGGSWRPALVVPALIVGLLAARRGGEQFPLRTTTARRFTRGRLPRSYWLFWLALVPAVGAEWTIGAWAADFMVSVADASPEQASILMTCFFGSVVVGRYLGSRVVHFIGAYAMVAAGVGVGLVGSALIWMSGELGLIATGLVLSGLGISVLFPMIVSLAVETAPEVSDQATARVSVAAGGATLAAPLAFGILADSAGIETAFALVLILLASVVLIAGFGRAVAES